MMTYDKNAMKVDACVSFRGTFITVKYDSFKQHPWLSELRDAVIKATDKLDALKKFVASHDNQTGPLSATVAQIADDENWMKGPITDRDKARRVRFITNFIGNPEVTWDSCHVNWGAGKPHQRKSDESQEVNLIKALTTAGEALDAYVPSTDAARDAITAVNLAVGKLINELKVIEDKRKQEAEAHQKELDEAKKKASSLSREDLIALAMKAGLL